jgi:hypothetical protein
VHRGSRESGRIRERQAALRFRAIFFEAGRVRACCSEVPERVADFRLLLSASIRSITGALCGCLTVVIVSPFFFSSIRRSTFSR